MKNPPAMHKTQVQFLGQEDPLEKEMAPHSSILAWEIPWTEESDGLQGVIRGGHINILASSELKWTGMGKLNSDNNLSTTVGKNPIDEMGSLHNQ